MTELNASRRKILGSLAVGAAGSIVGLSAAPASAHNTPVETNRLSNQPLYYVGNGYPGWMRTEYFNSTFYSRLQTWLQFYLANTPGNWGTPVYINHLGVHDDKGGAHQYGRAIDLSTVQFTDPSSGGIFNGMDCRHHIWGPGYPLIQKYYWAGVASLNYHLHYVLHYEHNAEHNNHVHADNMVSGGGSPSFSTGSHTQITALQATLKHIWGYSAISIDGGYGQQTDGFARQALTRIGRSGAITGSGNWAEFNRASVRFGSGRQSY